MGFKSRFRRWQIILTYILIAGLLALGGGVPVQADSGAGNSSFSSFTVTTETPAYFSGYRDNQGNYTKETPAYHFKFTTADNLQVGDMIQVALPHSFNFVGNPGFFWSANKAVPLANISAVVNGTPSGIIDAATTQYSDDGFPALSFQLSSAIASGAIVDVRLANFLITPDYHRSRPGLMPYALRSSGNSHPFSTTHGLFTRNVASYYPDANSYAASAVTGYHFKFTVMQPIEPSGTITMVFPQGATVPAWVDASKVKINGTPAASAVVSGNELTVQSTTVLPSFSAAVIDIAPSAQLANPSVPGYYNFAIKTSVDPMAATRRIGIISASGASLADNPSHNKGYVDEGNTHLRFMFTAPTILKAGDTVTVSSAPGTVLSEPGISAADITLEWASDDQEHNVSAAASVTRIADNKLQFVPPPEYYVDPDYHLIFNIPKTIVQGYGEYEFQVSTSQQVIPASVTLLVAPPQIQNFNVNASTRVAGAQNVSYTFAFQTNEPLVAGDDFNLIFPQGITVPPDIQASSVTVNGVQASGVAFDSFLRKLNVGVPMNLHLLDAVSITITGDAGLTNPAVGEYSFSVYPTWYSNKEATQTLNFATMTGIAVSPKTVELKLGNTVSKQLQVIASLSDQTAQDVTAASFGTTYSSSDTTVATVKPDGLIEAKQAGQAVITVTSGGYTDTVSVTVANADVPTPTVTGIAASPKSVELKLGSTVSKQLQVTASLSDQTARDVTTATYGTVYSSSDTTVATVKPDGLIEAKQAGQAVITVTSSGYTDTVSVTVANADVPTPAVIGIAASPRSVELKLGGTVSKQLQVTASLSDQTVQDVTNATYGTVYSSSDTTVATIKPDGLIEAKQTGQALITVTNSVYSDKVNVTVTADQQGGGTDTTSSSGSSHSAPQEIDSVEKYIVAAEGGSLVFDGVASVQIAPSSLPADGKIKIAKLPAQHSPLATGLERLSRNVVEFTSSTGKTFNRPVTLGFSYNLQQVGTGLKPAVYDYNESQARWMYLGGKVKGDGTIAVEVNHFGKFAVFASSIIGFADLKGHWVETYADRLIGMGVIRGFEDQTFRPNQKVTRAEFVKMAVDLLALKPTAAPAAFADNDSIPFWAKGAVDSAVEAGIIQGYEEQGKLWFKPNQSITRAEMAVILSKVLEKQRISGSVDKVAFSDQASIPDWAQSAVHAIASYKIVSGYEDGTFRPDNNATRAETVKMLFMLSEFLPL
ncbi:S-layer homology domain-containing protein [Paenibacillus filicis]|uniref:S-layer homology domain-containing protein n=1 Tax=Paenibacillus filicis TaxID=669464 RepID=A0ABU9DGB6_9BACL